MKIIICVVFLFFPLIIFSQSEENNVQKILLPKLDPAFEKEITDYLISNYKTPEDYVISKFKNHDIVFLGEEHYIKQYVELIHRLIPKLYENGIYNLGIEFANREDQALIDTVIYADEYNDSLAQKIMLNCGIWGYREYVDILKSAWKLNIKLSDKQRKFRIIGLNIKSDWFWVKTKEDRKNPDIMNKVWKNEDGDSFMARTIIEEIIDKNEKALIYAGSYHTFTKYHQPDYNVHKKKLVRFNEKRMGNIIFRKIGNKTFNIYLHGHWRNAKGWSEQYVYPVDGVIDTLMKKIPEQYRYVGFDVMNTTFGELKAETSFFKYGYDNFTLKDFCDGYIYLAPLSELKDVMWIENFVNESNIEEVKLLHPDPVLRDTSYTDKQKIDGVNKANSNSKIEWIYRIFE